MPRKSEGDVRTSQSIYLGGTGPEKGEVVRTTCCCSCRFEQGWGKGGEGLLARVMGGSSLGIRARWLGRECMAFLFVCKAWIRSQWFFCRNLKDFCKFQNFWLINSEDRKHMLLVLISLHDFLFLKFLEAYWIAFLSPNPTFFVQEYSKTGFSLCLEDFSPGKPKSSLFRQN